MKILVDSPFEDYVQRGDVVTKEVLSSGSPFFTTFKKVDAFLRTKLWGAREIEMSPIGAFLSMNAYMLCLSGTRVAMSGHAASSYPLFRTALESACYAHLITQDDDLASVWLERHSGPAALKACRRRFTSAVGGVAEAIDAAHPNCGIKAWLDDIYQAAIDFGAHPNPKSILHHVVEPENQAPEMVFSLTGLHSASSAEMARSLCAAVEYALAIAVILTFALPDHPEDLIVQLNELIDLKNQAVNDWNEQVLADNAV